MTELTLYVDLLNAIKSRIRQAQTKATFAVNTEMIFLYWDIGRMVYERQGEERWGAGVIPRLARDLRNELPEVKGFSERNIKLMTQFYREYPSLMEIGQRSVAQLKDESPDAKDVPQLVAELNIQAHNQEKGQQLVAQLGWAQNVLLMQKVKDLPTRFWYIQQTIDQGWSRDTLSLILCQTKDRILAEYALRDIHKPIGVSDYELTRSLPENLKSSLPTIEEIEAELQSDLEDGQNEP